MENKVQALQNDTNLIGILNSPVKTTPAVPTPDWSTSAVPAPVPQVSKKKFYVFKKLFI